MPHYPRREEQLLHERNQVEVNVEAAEERGELIAMKTLLGHGLELKIHQLIDDEGQQDDGDDDLQMPVTRYGGEDIAWRELPLFRIGCARANQRLAPTPPRAQKSGARPHQPPPPNQDHGFPAPAVDP